MEQDKIALISQEPTIRELLVIFDSLPSIIYVSDPETYKIVFANKTLCNIMGDDMIGKLCYKVLQGFDNPCDFCTNPEILSNGGKTVEWDYTNPITKRTYSVRDTMINWPNGRNLRLEIADDITPRIEMEKKLKESKELFDLALNAAEEGVWDWNLRTHKVYFSPQWKAQIGYQDDELENKFETWQDHLHPDDYDATHEALNNYIANPIGKFKVEFRFRHKNGSYRWIRNRSASLVDENGTLVRMFGAHSDVTELKQKTEQLKKEKQKAEQADMFKSSFLANMSHDLRTPLNSIIGFSELLDMTEDKEEQKQYKSIIKQNGQILLNLVNDIIDISKIEAGKLKLFKSEFNLDDFINRLNSIYTERLSSLPHSRNLELKAITPFISSNIQLYTDEARLYQIFTNLINNSIKFTDNGYIHFGYRVNKGIIDFFVDDSGIGIPQEQLDVIFERFGQVEDTLHRNTKGTGLGLTICRQLTEILGGEISIHSTEKVGTSIHFRFPKDKLIAKTDI